MAASASMLLLANSVVFGAGKGISLRVNHLVPAKYALRVRSMSENGPEEQPSTLPSESSKTPPPPTLPPSQPRLKEVSTKFADIFQFSGPANGPEEQPSTLPTESSKTPPPPTPPPSQPRLKEVSTKFADIFAFSGPAPERINGRLAMVGFVSELAVELSKGKDVFAQISDGGVSLFLATSILLSLASAIPLFSGVSVESQSEGFMTSDAELWNGRLAMLGLAALAFTEYVKGGTLL